MRRLRAALRNLVHGRREDRDLDAELRVYLEAAVEDYVRRGLTPEDALRAARLDAGGLEQVKEAVRDARAGSSLESLRRDFVYAARVLRRNRGFAAAAVLTIALAVGVNASMFSIVNALAFHRLPLADSDRLVSLSQTIHGKVERAVDGMGSFFSYSEYVAYRDRGRSLSGLAAYAPFVSASLGGEVPRRVAGTLASCNYFEVVAVRAALGRVLSAGDCLAGASPVVVLSDDLWRGAFGADPSIVGRAISLNRAPLVVIGVAPRGFKGPDLTASAFWAPLTSQRALQPGRDHLAADNLSWLELLGRLAPGVALGQARAELTIVAGQIDRLQPGRQTRLDVRVATILPQPEVRKIVLGIGAILLAAVALVLVAACANVANLLLARAAARRREIAIRLAIGASRWRLVRQLLVESLMIAAAGGALGSLVALWASAALVDVVLARLPGWMPALVVPVGPDLHVLAYCAAITALTGVAFGLVPALATTRLDLVSALKQQDPARPNRQTARGASRWQYGLVATQVAASTVLLMSAVLLARGLARTYGVDPGFDASNVAVMSFDLEDAGYDPVRAADFTQRLLERMAAVPGVDRVALARTTPLSDTHVEMAFSVTGTGRTPARQVQLELNCVSPGYFTMFHISIVRGRNFSEAEQRQQARVAIVTEAAARHLWPGADPIGQTLSSDEATGAVRYDVIGVARDAQVSRMGEPKPVYVYLPPQAFAQPRMQVLARYGTRLSAVAGGLRAAAAELDRALPVDVADVNENLELWRMPARAAVLASVSLGALALVLSAVALYGLVAYAVSRRVREIGVRVALGASGRDLARLVGAGLARPLLAGTLAGLVAAAAGAQLLSRLLFGLSPFDPLAYAAVPLFLLAVAAAAAWLPARRAMRLDPMTALRGE